MDQQIIQTIKNGGIVVAPTDTIYGLLAPALNPAAVLRLRELRERPADKPFIILISDLSDLALFKVVPTPEQTSFLNSVWPGPVSVILNDLAFRLPNYPELRQIIAKTGPLVAPSANPSGQPPATTIAEARQYFGDQVDLYVDGGHLAGQPSTLVRLAPDGRAEVLRGILKP